MIETDLTDDGLKLSLNSGLVFTSGSTIIQTEQSAVLDRMLGGEFVVADVDAVLGARPKKCATALFSATMNEGVRELAANCLRADRVVLGVLPSLGPPLVEQRFAYVGEDGKRVEALAQAIREGFARPPCLVFARCAPAADAAVAPTSRTSCTGPVASAFCDALRKWILGQGKTAVEGSELPQFYEAHPHAAEAVFVTVDTFEDALGALQPA